MPRTTTNTYSLVVRFGSKEQCSWIRHGETFATVLDAEAVAREYAKSKIKALVKRTSYLDSQGLPDGWLGT